MKRGSKILRIVLLVILVLIFAVVVFVNFFANRAVRVGIESVAAKALNIGITVDNVDLSMIRGKLVLQNLSIVNPPAYKHDELLILKNTEIEVEPKSLLSDVVNVKQIRINDVDVIIEQHGVSANNLQDIVQAISESTYEGKKLRVDNLEISDISVKFDLMPNSEQAEPATLTLSPIRMTNLGYDNQLDTAALLKEIIYAIADSIVEEGISVLPTDILSTMTSTLNKTIELGTKIMEGKEDIGRGITEGIKKLLKPRKEE
jgi:uncharacterized protein involved in outer membrane biogenesis